MESQPEKEATHRIEFLRVGKNLSDLWGNVAVNNFENSIIRDSIQRIGAADAANVQLIAASQLELLAGYHQIALAAVPLALSIAFLSGVIVEIVAGIVCVLSGKTTAQLRSFQSRLEVLQRYLLANSLCEALDGDDRNKARAALIKEISHPQVVQGS